MNSANAERVVRVVAAIEQLRGPRRLQLLDLLAELLDDDELAELENAVFPLRGPKPFTSS